MKCENNDYKILDKSDCFKTKSTQCQDITMKAATTIRRKSCSRGK